VNKIPLFAAALCVIAAAAVFSADKASIVYMDGNVTLNGSAASVGDEVKAGATIQTDPDAVCEIVFNTRNVLHMMGGTVLTFDPKVLSRGATLRKGAVGMVLRNLAPSPGGELRFSIKTPTTVAGVRGTCFLVNVEDEDHTYICCCNGSIHLEGSNGAFSQNIVSSHHREIRVARSGTGVSATAAPLLYHSDQDVEALAARIGEKIDWTRIDK